MTAQTAEPTPRPWTQEGHLIYSGGKAGGTICSMSEVRHSHFVEFKKPSYSTPHLDEISANAALIVRAVNAHDDLVEALEDAKVTLEEAAKLLVSNYPSVANNIVNQCAIRCGDVLAKATAP